MKTKYIRTKTAEVFDKPDGKRSCVLIYGDEVEAGGAVTAGQTRITCRGREGVIKTSALGAKPALELYFIDVGTGDAAFIVTPGRKKILIDGGLNKRALGFLAWKYRLDQPGHSVDLDLLVLTHADDDHITGLIPVVQHPGINVKKIVHSGIATYADGAFKTELGALSVDKKHLVTRHSTLADLGGARLSPLFASWIKAIKAKGATLDYGAVSTETGELKLGDDSVKLEVLGPVLDKVGGKPAYPWFGDKAHTINGHSVVLRLTHDKVRVLFTGDLNTRAEERLLAKLPPAAFDAHVLKAPHHGSQEFTPAFLKAVRPQISVISSGDERDFGHPRANFIGAVGRASRGEEPLVFSTELAGNFVEVDAKEGPQPANASPDAKRRVLFKRRLNGMINVRSDGAKLFAARRVAASFWWESYDLTPAAP